jgi:HlyD family secretion protein
MSALPTLPQPSPEKTGLSALANVPTPPKRSRGPIYFLVMVLIAGAAWYFRPQQGKTSKTASVQTVRAVRGTVASTRRVAGSITARRFANIVVPVLQAPDTGRGLTLTYLASSGHLVNEGDLIAEIDGQDMKDHLDDVEAQVVQFDLDIKKRQSVQAAQREAMLQRIRATRGELLKAKEDLKALAVKSAISQEQLKLTHEEAEAAYKEVQAELPLMEEQLRADMAITMLDYQRQLRHRDRHRRDLDHLRIKSPIDGMVVLQTSSRRGELTQIRVGDLVASGQPVMRVVDPGSMQLEAMMNQSEAELVRLGQTATLRFDAFPDIVLHGDVEYVGAMAIGGRFVNYQFRRIPVHVAIRKSDARVIPDLSASADIVTSDTQEGLLVPRESVTEASGKPVVYVRQDTGFIAREVEISGENNTQFAVTGGLREGEEIALDPHSVILP